MTVKQSILFMILSAGLFVACDSTNSDEQDATVNTETTDSLAAAQSSDKTAVDNNSATAESLVGKPNPAKKGGKGKVSTKIETNAAGQKMEKDKDGAYAAVEVQPQFPGGEDAMRKFIEDNIQYPQSAIDDGVEGIVRVSFAVDESGKIYNPQVLGDKIGYGFEEEALKVLKKMPKWTPGKVNGKMVKTKLSLPISFEIGS